VGEEGGLLLTLAVSGAFLFLALRGLKIAHDCSDRFGQLLGVGISASVFTYAALNMYVADRAVPGDRLPLPFLSYGGSALLVNAFSVGVMLNLSKRLFDDASPRRVDVESRLPVAAR
jgi:cell division protein FtsW